MDNVHKPVLMEEVIEYMNLKKDGIYVDLTIGAGGHSFALLEKMNGEINIIGVDRDKEILEIAKERLSPFANKCSFYHKAFIEIPQILEKHGVKAVDGVLMDIGVSSLQFDQGQRGFSLQKEGPLDMRMNPEDTLTAEYIVNNYSEFDLAKIMYEYGEERKSRQIAKAIVSYRDRKKIRSTLELANLIVNTLRGRGKIHPATLTFQALRIEVNGELEQLEYALKAMPGILNDNGRVVVISFHSLEDRIVKRFFKENDKLTIITKKPVTATPEETRRNPRSRSAKLRCAEMNY